MENFLKNNSLIYQPPVFMGLALTSYSAAHHLRTRIMDFFKSPRPMILAVKAFFEIFKTYSILRFLSQTQIDNRINPPKEPLMKMEKTSLIQQMSKQLAPSTKLKQVLKCLSEPLTLYLYDTIQECFRGDINRVDWNGQYFYQVQ